VFTAKLKQFADQFSRNQSQFIFALEEDEDDDYETVEPAKDVTSGKEVLSTKRRSKNKTNCQIAKRQSLNAR